MKYKGKISNSICGSILSKKGRILENFVCKNQIDFVSDGSEDYMCKINTYIKPYVICDYGCNLVVGVLALQSTKYWV